jgi:hypothetical protein
MPMRIALATCADLPDWEVDDRPLHEALRARGAEVQHPHWTDRTFDWASVDCCLIRTTWDYHFNRDEFVAWARDVEAKTLLFNPSAVVEWNTDKRYLQELAQQGVPVIATEWLEHGSKVDLGHLLRHNGWRRGFLKPVIGATAFGTCRFEDHGDSLATAQRFVDEMLVDHAMQLQPYLERVETEGEESMIFVNGRHAHSVRKVPVPGDYRVQDDHGASDEPFTHNADDIELASSVLRLVQAHPSWANQQQVQPLLYGRTDWLRDEEGGLRLCELELVEPSLFLRHGPATADLLAEALIARIHAAP